MRTLISMLAMMLGLTSWTGCGKGDAKAPTTDEAAQLEAPQKQAAPGSTATATPPAGEAPADAPKPTEAEKAQMIEAAKTLAKSHDGAGNAAVATCKKAAACCTAASEGDDAKLKQCKQLEELAGLGAMMKEDAQAKMKGQCEMLLSKIAETVSPVPDACK